MAKVGRKGKYESLIKPKFNEIKESLNGGASEEQVAKSLGISYSAWNKYKREHQEFYELVNAPRTQLIDNLKSALVKIGGHIDGIEISKRPLVGIDSYGMMCSKRSSLWITALGPKN